MRNPLNKRLLRELTGDIGKYIVIFILLVLSIGFVSGFLVAGESMIKAYDESFERYNIEDGNFRTEEPLSDARKAWIEEKGVTVYENFYVEKEFDNGTRLRIFADRKEVDKVCVMEGRLPETYLEIAIDRMYADNNDLSVGSTMVSGENSYTVVGLVALSDYSALFYSNNDMMFDSSAFGVAVVSRQQLEEYDEGEVRYGYCWIYYRNPASEEEEKEVSDELMEAVS